MQPMSMGRAKKRLLPSGQCALKGAPNKNRGSLNRENGPVSSAAHPLQSYVSQLNTERLFHA